MTTANTSTENLITLNEARDLLPHHPDLATLFRWCLKGCRGVKLSYTRCGRRVLTSREALHRFMDELTALDEQRASGSPAPAPRTRSARRRSQQIEAAQKRLAATGF